MTPALVLFAFVLVADRALGQDGGPRGVFNNCDYEAALNVTIMGSCANRTAECQKVFAERLDLRGAPNPPTDDDSATDRLSGACHCFGVLINCLPTYKCTPVDREEEDQVKSMTELTYNQAVDQCLVACGVEACRLSGFDTLGNIHLGMRRVTYPLFFVIFGLATIAIGVLAARGTELPFKIILLVVAAVHLFTAILMMWKSPLAPMLGLYVAFWAAVTLHGALSDEMQPTTAFFYAITSSFNLAVYTGSYPSLPFNLVVLLQDLFTGCETNYLDDRCTEYQIFLAICVMFVVYLQAVLAIVFWVVWHKNPGEFTGVDFYSGYANKGAGAGAGDTSAPTYELGASATPAATPTPDSTPTPAYGAETTQYGNNAGGADATQHNNNAGSTPEADSTMAYNEAQSTMPAYDASADPNAPTLE